MTDSHDEVAAEGTGAQQAALLQQRLIGFFGDTLGIRFISASKSCIRAELPLHESLYTLPGIVHGGAIMAFADQLGAAGTVLNLPPGAGTTTLESKTNFIGSALNATKLVAESTPLHRGGTTMVWQTKISTDAGKVVAYVTQTQMVLRPRE